MKKLTRGRVFGGLSRLDFLTVLTVLCVGFVLRDVTLKQPLTEVVLFDSSECDKEAPKAKLRIVPFKGKTFGAEVFGFDPQFALQSPAQLAGILHALEKHLVLVFHNVSDKLSPADHVRLGKAFGPVDPEISSPPSYLKKGIINSPDQVKKALERGGKASELGNTMLKAAEAAKLGLFPVEVTRIVKEPNDLLAFGEGYHSDLTYRPATPFAAILVSRELPEDGGGDTHFLDMRVAFERLPENIQRELRGLRANHTDGHDLWTVHPTIRHDNKDGRDSLFVNKAFTRHMVYPSSESTTRKETLLQTLFQYIDLMPDEHTDAFLDVKWEEGDMVMWDNRFTQHAAQGGYNTRREMHRVIVSGTVPF